MLDLLKEFFQYPLIYIRGLRTFPCIAPTADTTRLKKPLTRKQLNELHSTDGPFLACLQCAARCSWREVRLGGCAVHTAAVAVVTVLRPLGHWLASAAAPGCTQSR